MVKVLKDAYPEAATIKNENGITPSDLYVARIRVTFKDLVDGQPPKEPHDLLKKGLQSNVLEIVMGLEFHGEKKLILELGIQDEESDLYSFIPVVSH
jgi:hypothetical protein